MAEGERRVHFRLCALLFVASLVACTQQTPPQQTAAADRLVSLKDGVPVIATALVSNAKLSPPPPSGRYPVVIDPWIDVTTGSQVATTKLMQHELEALAPQHFPQLELLPFTPDALTRKPLADGLRCYRRHPLRRFLDLAARLPDRALGLALERLGIALELGAAAARAISSGRFRAAHRLVHLALEALRAISHVDPLRWSGLN